MSIKTVADLKCPWFHARGTRVYDVKQEWQNTQFVTVLEPSEYQAGDNYLMQCALGFRTDAQWRDYFNKSGNFGVTARGLISFGDAYTKLLQAHRMKTGTGGPAGITFTGYNNAVGSIESKGKGALILGTTIVGRLALSLSKEWVSVQVGYYDIPCLGSGNEVVSCRVRETDFSIRRPHKKGTGVVESDEDIITKFLKFGLSLSDMSFPNVCELIVYCGQPVNGSVDMGKVVGELNKATQKKVPYANPNIIYNVRKGNSVVKMESLLRPLTEELTSKLRDCKYQPSFFGRTGNAYWGDYLVNRSMQTPFDFGATVEETAVNCIDYCNKHRWGNYTKQEDAAEDFDAVEWESDAVEEQRVQDDSFDGVEWEEDAVEVSADDFDAAEWEDDTTAEEEVTDGDAFAVSGEEKEKDFDGGMCGYFQVPFIEYGDDILRLLVGRIADEDGIFDMFCKTYSEFEKYVTRPLYERLARKIAKNIANDKFGLLDKDYSKGVQQLVWSKHLMCSSLTHIGTAGNMRWPLGRYDEKASIFVGNEETFERFFEKVDNGYWHEMKYGDTGKFKTVKAYLRDFELEEIHKFPSVEKARSDFSKLWKAKMAELGGLSSNDFKKRVTGAAQELMNTFLWKNHKPVMTDAGDRYKYALDVKWKDFPLELAKAMLLRKREFNVFGIGDELVSWGYRPRTVPELDAMSEAELRDYRNMVYRHSAENNKAYFSKYFMITPLATIIACPESFSVFESNRREAKIKAGKEECKKTIRESVERREREVREKAEREAREKAMREEREQAERAAEEQEKVSKCIEYTEDFEDGLRRRLFEAVKDNHKVFELDERDADIYYNPFVRIGEYLTRRLADIFKVDVAPVGNKTLYVFKYYYQHGEDFFNAMQAEVYSLFEEVCGVLTKEFYDVESSNLTINGKWHIDAWREALWNMASEFESDMNRIYADSVYEDRVGDFSSTYTRLVADCKDMLDSIARAADDVDTKLSDAEMKSLDRALVMYDDI